MTMTIVAGDIGGTHARFALAGLIPGAPPRLGRMHKYRTRDHASLRDAWTAFRRDIGAELPSEAAFGIASPIEGELLRFTNSAWTIDRRTIAAELGLDRLLLLNDFGAVGHAVSALGPNAFEHLFGPEHGLPDEGAITVIGPGTGLGVSMILRRGGRTEVVETEGGHIAFAPRTGDERELEQAIRARHGRCSIERIASGPGLLDIHHFLGGEDDDANTVWTAAIERSDPIAVRALDLLAGALGAAAGDLSLAHGSSALVITGSLANRIRQRLASSLFHDRFVAKGRYEQRMQGVSVLLLTEPEPGLLGAAIAFQRSLEAP